MNMLACAVIVSNAVGNCLLRAGLASVGPIFSLSPVDYLKAFANAWVIAGVVVLFVWMVLQLILLSWADLSYVLPVTATAYVLIVTLGAIALHEHVTAMHWAGVGLILAGAAMVGRTKARSQSHGNR